ncbi:hypothetical protein F5Y15DRAFT_142967 [Xylariaceae sp. FL0016]|nr:hypothetical protein F5Y15DRAFT_142967 [Xylariaceae sp. FL0016]
MVTQRRRTLLTLKTLVSLFSPCQTSICKGSICHIYHQFYSRSRFVIVRGLSKTSKYHDLSVISTSPSSTPGDDPATLLRKSAVSSPPSSSACLIKFGFPIKVRFPQTHTPYVPLSLDGRNPPAPEHGLL